MDVHWPSRPQMDFFPELEEFGWCPFARVAGKPCILCGGTRAVLSFLGGDFNAAWHFHPVVTVLFPTGLLFLAGRYVQFSRGSISSDWKSFFFGKNSMITNHRYISLFISGALMWAWNIGRW